MATLAKKIKGRWLRFSSAPLAEKLEILAFFFLCIFFFDCATLGGGRVFEIGPITSRMIFAGIAICCILPAIFKNFRKWITHPVNLLVIAFVLYLGISAVRGIVAGNRMNVLISDIKGFAWIILVPAVMAIVDSKEKFARLLSVIVAGAVVQAVFVILLNWFCAIVPDGIKYVYDPIMDSNIGTISNISTVMFRIFMKSSPYLALACGVVTFRQLNRKKISPKYIAIFVLCAYALLLSFTRSIYGCMFVVLGATFVLVLILNRDKLLTLLKYLGVVLAIFLAFNYVQEFAFKANYMNFAISRTLNVNVTNSPVVELRYMLDGWLSSSGGGVGEGNIGTEEQEKYLSDTDSSDNIRAKTKVELKELIIKNPIVGNGLGASAPSREDGLDEYFYLDILARMGIVGLILYILPFGYVALKAIKKRRAFGLWPDSNGAMSGMLGFWAVSWFNPWMNAVLGIACYAFICSVVPILDTENEKESF